jgi:hypothetical protein
MLKKEFQKIIKGGLLITIGDWDIDFPVEPGWKEIDDLIDPGYEIIDKIVIFSVVVAVVMVIVSGYTLITSAGNPEKVERGQKTLSATIIGIILIYLVSMIIKYILTQLGFNIAN